MAGFKRTNSLKFVPVRLGASVNPSASEMVLSLRHDPSVQRYVYFWIKYVNGVNLEQHCQRCLIGPCSKRVSSRTFKRCNKAFEFVDIKLDECRYKAVYICGVTEGYVWKSNFHLALAYCPGQIVRMSGAGLEVQVKNGIALPILSSQMDPNFHLYSEHKYATCRNAQFAWGFRNHYYDEMINEGWQPPRTSSSVRKK